MPKKSKTLTAENIRSYAQYLREQERSSATLQKYVHDLHILAEYLDGKPITKAALIAWKEELTGAYAPASVNSMLTVANGFLRFMGWQASTVKLVKIQKALFLDDHRELTRNEYARLVRAAELADNQRLSLVIQTICSTGIRVSELRFITAEAVALGRAEITNKGKRRTVFLPDKLRRLLRHYLQAQKKSTGAIFVTRTGRPLDRSNIWRDMKRLCESAGVEPSKVFPHNLRHLFARTYYTMEKDLSRLADILGHSSVATTRIYTAESGTIHAQQVGRLGLVLTT